jgi:hypothetical protein
MSNEIKISELESHLDDWFGDCWDNQSEAQIWAMTIDLMNKVGVKVTDTEGFRTVEQMAENGEIKDPPRLPKY